MGHRLFALMITHSSCSPAPVASQFVVADPSHHTGIFDTGRPGGMSLRPVNVCGGSSAATRPLMSLSSGRLEFQFEEDPSQFLPAAADGGAPEWKPVCCRYRKVVCHPDARPMCPEPEKVCKSGGDGETPSSCPTSLPTWGPDINWAEGPPRPTWHWTGGALPASNALDCHVVLDAPPGYVTGRNR